MIYKTADKANTNLGDRELYSRKLTSIERHPDLKTLNKRQCVLTVHKDFTPHQKHHVRGKIAALIRPRDK